MSGNIPKDIKVTILDLVADFRDHIFTKPEEQESLLTVEFILNKTNATTLADKIVMHVLSRRKQIESRDAEFFIAKRKEIFQGLPDDRVEYFASLIQKSEEDGGMSDENKEKVWEYFDTLVHLAGEYNKKNK